MSARIAAGFAEWRECRAEYDQVLYARYERAAEACNEALLNERGRRKRIDPISLFMGPSIRAYAYASPELIEHWEAYPRLTYAEFELQWMSSRESPNW
ncbi:MULTISPECIES: hypothetical protein [Microbacterium]|uniref:Uncharacterized protein n=1 Tax=Microbacterium hominis TaxID=162426 RepID=A0A2K9DF65_9MICO|nr:MULTISPECIES: hypothetical protein [Microbacterium]AUG29579.1 hypothetical protein CXR34_09040 [Microbacterium hominis]EPD84289.1 hypothetical protein HMPREF1529_02354 [Microbacterium sp. oral taxon 186 str. F0373]